jgi:adenylate kinase family enzyme
MRRIAVVGCGGAGKSRLSVELGRRLGLPVIHLDAHFWKPGWVATPDDEWEALQPALFAGDAWVVDGNFHRTLRHRLERADTVVHLDFPLSVCLRGALTRLARHFGEVRPDMGRGCPEGVDVAFLLWLLRFRRDVRPAMCATLRDFASRGGRVVRLRDRPAVGAFLRGLRPRGPEPPLGAGARFAVPSGGPGR